MAFAIAHPLDLSHSNAIGVVLIGACPGDVTSDVLSHYARGDVVLSVSLTAIPSAFPGSRFPCCLRRGGRSVPCRHNITLSCRAEGSKSCAQAEANAASGEDDLVLVEGDVIAASHVVQVAAGYAQLEGDPVDEVDAIDE